MKAFVLRTLFFLFLLSIGGFIVFCFADEYTDAYYMRFSTPKQSSLILGTSRAAQGIAPDILNKTLGRSDIFNYAFTLGHSPYGPVYLKSIQKKLDPDTKGGVFILTVDPWSVSSHKEKAGAPDEFEEAELAVSTPFVSMHPNVPYLYEYYGRQYQYLLHDKSETTFLHSNGWLEITIDMDSSKVERRTKNKMEEYKERCPPHYVLSESRWQALEETGKFLQEHGTVYLVRMPCGEGIFGLEKEYFPEFDTLLTDLSEKNQWPLIDLTTQKAEYRYTDGNHLYKGSVPALTSDLGALILLTEK